jgi:hypothetical protein
MLDHDTDSYYKISRAFLGGPPSGNLTHTHILDNVTLYWLTGTGVSVARSYWENARAAAGGVARPLRPSPSRSPSAPSRASSTSHLLARMKKPAGRAIRRVGLAGFEPASQ